ncbi:Peritrophin-48-like 1 [Homarus americanus]|uniref:Peritrophin-48-like 1 n=1 Tax=Homarus americanus TaxID=6706 RepID=A0A8J5NAS4_HOMAM|nr:Peritrophin-48-like 1 [Homarus americanus]
MRSTLPITLILALLVCAPDCSKHNSGDSVRDPSDCTNYYECVDVGGEVIPSTEPVPCGDKDYFNPEHGNCEPIDSADDSFCDNLCNPCAISCKESGIVVPDPEDCNIYYVCLENEISLKQTCPYSAEYFDFRTGKCSQDDTVCYEYCDICKPHCTLPDTKVPDPYDCNKFYQCNPPHVVSFTCPHGEVFDRKLYECIAGANCIIDCE